MTTILFGSNGFLGKNLIPKLVENREDFIILKKEECDLQNLKETSDVFKKLKPHTIINLAGRVGGFLANRNRPADLGLINLQIGTNLCVSALGSGVKRIINFLGSCSYPSHITEGIREEDLATGLPDKTSAPYAMGKTAIHFNLMAMNKQYGMQNITIVPSNVYGPYDHFDPEDGHVVPALICKIHAAKTSNMASLKMVGSGLASRDFLYAPDLLEPLKQIIEMTDINNKLPGIMNFGTQKPTSIQTLAHHICDVVGYHGELIWEEHNINDGQSVKYLNCDQLKHNELNFEITSLDKGIELTYQNFLETR